MCNVIKILTINLYSSFFLLSKESKLRFAISVEVQTESQPCTIENKNRFIIKCNIEYHATLILTYAFMYIYDKS